MEDIIFDNDDILFELPFITLNGEITGFSMDGNNFDLEQEPIIFNNKETSHIFVT